jgi:hypothetical protein
MTTQYRDGEWVTARPAALDARSTDLVACGPAPLAPRLHGQLTVLRAPATGVVRYSVNGITVERASLRRAMRPTS